MLEPAAVTRTVDDILSPEPGVYYVRDGANGPLLYVGSSNFPWRRVLEHRTARWWPANPVVTVESHHSRTAAFEAEKKAIAELRPPHNVTGNPDAKTQREASITIRLNPASFDAIDRRAAQEARTRSGLIRLMLKYALTKMPEGWTG